MKTRSTEKIQRRSFLKGTAVAGAAVGAGAISTRTVAAALEDDPVKTEQKGYRETKHIQEYYRLARF